MQELEGSLAVLEAQQAGMREAAESQHSEVCLLVDPSSQVICRRGSGYARG